MLSCLVSSAFKIYAESTTSDHFHCNYFIQIIIISHLDDNVLLPNLSPWFHACFPKEYSQLRSEWDSLTHVHSCYSFLQNPPKSSNLSQTRDTIVTTTYNAWLPLWPDLLQICPLLTPLRARRSSCCFLSKSGMLPSLHFLFQFVYHLPGMLILQIANNLLQNTSFNSFSKIHPLSETFSGHCV